MASDLLLVDFATRQPREMANLLAGADPAEVLALLGELPYPVAAQLAACLPGQQLKVLLRRMAPDFTASLLLAARHEQAVALVSHLPESAYADILAAADRRQRTRLTRLFDVPTRSVAALAVPDFLRVLADTSCADLAQQLAVEALPRQPILVVDEQGVFIGEVQPVELFAAGKRAQPVREIAERVNPLNGRVSAEDALEAAEWEDHFQLPVVDGKHRLLGVVHRSALSRHAAEDAPLRFGLDAVILGVAVSYLDFCEHALKLLLARHSR